MVASDQIYMLENGQITESGTHGDLMKKQELCNMYQETAGIVSGEGREEHEGEEVEYRLWEN